MKSTVLGIGAFIAIFAGLATFAYLSALTVCATFLAWNWLLGSPFGSTGCT